MEFISKYKILGISPSSFVKLSVGLIWEWCKSQMGGVEERGSSLSWIRTEIQVSNILF